jgi:hypothetical protein
MLWWPLVAQVSTITEQNSPGFSLHIEAKPPSVKLGSAITIEVTLTNTSNSDLLYNPGDFGEDVNVRDERGSALKATPEGEVFKGTGDNHKVLPNGMYSFQTRGNGNGKLLIIKPKESAVRSLTIDGLFDFRSPGKYTVEVTRKDLDSKVTVKSNIIAVTLVP